MRRNKHKLSSCILQTDIIQSLNNDKAIRILREMKNILMQTGSGDEHGFVDNILQEMANKLPKE